VGRAIGESWDAAVRRRPTPSELAPLAPDAVLRAIVRGYAALAAPVS
jgi:hypothetical protein